MIHDGVKPTTSSQLPEKHIKVSLSYVADSIKHIATPAKYMEQTIRSVVVARWYRGAISVLKM